MERTSAIDAPRTLAVATYAVLGAALVSTRLVGLDRSYASDELMIVRNYVREGPREILSGAYIPNNHELFSLLGWATTSLVGESEIALRLWSVVPFLAGVALVTAWLHARLGALSGVLFLFFCTFSPLLLDITRQARGYGLAFLAMSVLVVAALEAERTGRRSLVVVACVAGVVGTWTLPQFAIAFFATGLALLVVASPRRFVAAGLGVSAVAIAAWYAPRAGDLLENSEIEYGVRIGTAGLLTAPLDQILVPALLWIDGTVLVLRPVWLPVLVGIAILVGSSALLRRRESAALVLSGPVATVLAIWIAGIYVVPRYLSYLLVPLLVLLATGIASILTRLPTRPALARTLLALGVVVSTGVVFVRTAPDVLRLPREAHRDVATAIARGTPPSTPVFAYMTRPAALEYYLGRQVVRPASSDDPEVCAQETSAVLVVQPWVLPPASFACLDRPGVTSTRFEQYTRGDEMVVWVIPPAD